MNLVKTLSNPIRVRILQYLQSNGDATTKQVANVLDDVPTPTLYRHVNALLEDNLIIVKEERKVRGSLERLLGINEETMQGMCEDDVAASAYQYCMELYSRFQTYSSKGKNTPKEDKLLLSSAMLLLSDEEFDTFFEELSNVIKKYQENSKTKDRKLRSISLVSSPTEDVWN